MAFDEGSIKSENLFGWKDRSAEPMSCFSCQSKRKSPLAFVLLIGKLICQGQANSQSLASWITEQRFGIKRAPVKSLGVQFSLWTEWASMFKAAVWLGYLSLDGWTYDMIRWSIMPRRSVRIQFERLQQALESNDALLIIAGALDRQHWTPGLQAAAFLCRCLVTIGLRQRLIIVRGPNFGLEA